jgi:hypothetical protein
MTNEPCINWPCAKGAGHAGPCGTSRDEQPVQPSSNELLSQAWDDIDSLMEYAFDNGFHELGYDPARVISDEMERVAQELADLKAAGSSAPEPDAEVSVLIDRVNARIPSSVTPSTRIEIHPSEWLRLADALRPAQPPCVWQPIETAPRDREVLFWIVPLSPEETYTDTSGNPIVSNAPPHLLLCRYGRWSSISKASHWADVPRAPVTKESAQ